LAAAIQTTLPANSAQPPRQYGRRYGFLCSYCSSRLEAVESMAAQQGTCPTCGNTIIIPILDNRGRLIDPTTNEVLKQDPHPVHAYAAAGHRAPQIVTDPGGNRAIDCPRCHRMNAISSNNCLGCGLPFTMDGTMGDAISGTNTWAIASLVLGIVSMPFGFCLLVPPVLAIVFGAIALRGMGQTSSPQSGQGMAIAGIILGVIGLVLLVLVGSNYMHLF
jgi:DNA-directed RNA polymerase subunit RPC12/RpoP